MTYVEPSDYASDLSCPYCACYAGSGLVCDNCGADLSNLDLDEGDEGDYV